MLVVPREVAYVLGLILSLLVLKHVPALDVLPLSQVTGIVCFTFSIYLSLRIYRAELARIRSE